MPTDTSMSATAVCVCAARATIPQFDRQQTSVTASCSASLVKQRAPYLVAAPRFIGNTQATLYGPLPGLIWPWDVWVESISWNSPGGIDEVAEIRDGSGATIWRGVAQVVDDSNFSNVKIQRFARGGYAVPVLDSGRLDIQLGRTLRNA